MKEFVVPAVVTPDPEANATDLLLVRPYGTAGAGALFWAWPCMFKGPWTPSFRV